MSDTDLTEITERLDQLEQENKRLRRELDQPRVRGIGPQAKQLVDAVAGAGVSRRHVVSALVGAGILGVTNTGIARAQNANPGFACSWIGDTSAQGYGLYDLGTLEGGVTGDTELTSLIGSGLSIQNGMLTVDADTVTPWNDDDGDDLLEPNAPYTGIDVPTIATGQASITNEVTFGETNGRNSGADSWNDGPITSGTGQSFDTGIDAATGGSSLLLVSFKRDASARIDTYLFIANQSGAAGSDESNLVDSTTNQAGSGNVSISVNGSGHFVLNADLDNDMQLVSVTATGFGI